jgi:hypothetical protein
VRSLPCHSVLAVAVLAVAAACGSKGHPLSADGTPDTSPGGSGSPVFSTDAGSAPFAGDDGGSATASPPFTGPLPGPFQDFPASPLLVTTDAGGAATPANAADLFGPGGQGTPGSGPCLVEPEVGALYPNNWLRPRFAWVTPNSEDLFELRVHADNQANDLVVYTTDTRWIMPRDMWQALAAHSQDVPMTVSLRGGLLEAGKLTNEAIGSSGPIGIAPVSAPGNIVYWAVDGSAQTGALKGFAIGDETVGPVLAPSQVTERAPPAGVPCIGCHASTPDGLNVGFQIGYDEGSPGAYTDSIATIGTNATPGLVPSFLTADAKAAMDALGGIPAYSAAHWKAGDRVVLLSDTGDLHWVNLEATGASVTGVVARGPADAHLATDPSWSHDGSTIVYTSASGIYNGRQQNGPMDLYTVPYNGGAGGAAAPIAGASEAGFDEYYPALSPDAKYVAYNRAPTGDNPYSDPKAEIYVIPAAGDAGGGTRLAANDPPACTHRSSPGVTNSWGKWSPSVESVPVLGLTYYWIVFSSSRYPSGPAQDSPQLYVTAMVVDGSGKVTTYPALYLWNQPPDEHNHTPAWDYFQIPPPPPPPDLR